MQCPDCKGCGTEIASHVLYADGTGKCGVRMKCLRCHGKGQVSDDMPHWIEQGRKLKERRMTPYRTLREEAKALGIDVVTLSQMETGKIKPIEV